MPIFCAIDEFCHAFEPVYSRRLLHLGQRQRTRQTALAPSAMRTLLVSFHWRHYRTCKHDYTAYVAVHLRPSCPHLVSDQRCVEWLPRALVPWGRSLATRQGRCPGRACSDSTPRAVCATPRIAPQTVLAGLARRGKPARGWF